MALYKRWFGGDEVDLFKIPFHQMCDADAGPYNGGNLAIVKDPKVVSIMSLA